MIVVCGMLFALFAICFLAYLNVAQNQAQRVIEGSPYDKTFIVAQPGQDRNPERLDLSTRTKSHVPAAVYQNGLPAEDVSQ
jgi:hypothetical protein